MVFLMAYLANMMEILRLIMRVQKYTLFITKTIKIYTKKREDFSQKNQIVHFWDQLYLALAVRICSNQTITIICQRTIIIITMTNKIDQPYNGDTKY